MGGSSSSCSMKGRPESSCKAADPSFVCSGFHSVCSGNDVWMDSYSIAKFMNLDVRSSSFVFGADNHVQIRFSLDRYIPPGSTIQIQLDSNRISLPNERATVFGRSRWMFETSASWSNSTSSLVLTAAQGIPSRTNLSLSVVFVNLATYKASSSLEVSVSSRSDYFTSRRSESGATFGSRVAAQSRMLTEVSNGASNQSSGARFIHKSVMMDLTALNSVFISSISLEVPSSAQTLDVYYKQGSYQVATRNLSEWRLLGRAHTQSLKRGADGYVLLHLSDLETQFSEAEAKQFGQDMSDPMGVPGISTPQKWLGPRPQWVENSPRHMSSTLGRGVDIKEVLNLSKNALWHSGNGTSIWSEAGCPHLPKCPQHWPFDKFQWLSMDSKVCYTISAFRTTFPNHTKAPAYYYGGILRSNIDADDWYSAHYKHFELQYSAEGLDGPWLAAVRGEARAPRSVEWPLPSSGETQGPRLVWAGGDKAQEFFFQPVTARYWRIVFEDTFGFGFVAIQSIEFYGFESPWCSESKWCRDSHLCSNAQYSLVSAHYSQVMGQGQKTTMHRNGLALTAGLHSLMLSGSHGFIMSQSNARRSDVFKAGSSLLLHHAAQIDRVCAAGSLTCAQNYESRIESEYLVQQWTSPLGALKHLRLPTKVDSCYRHWRILVRMATNLSSGGPADGAALLCLDEIVLFSQGDPDWIVHQSTAADAAVSNASSELDGCPASNAFDGSTREGNDAGSSTFCWGTQGEQKWISLSFENESCIEGYAILHRDGEIRLTAWDLQGSSDNLKWATIDRRRQEVSGNLFSKFVLPQQRSADYLFANGLTYGFSNPVGTNYNDESPRLYRFEDRIEGWSTHQLFAGGGTHDVEHFVIEQEHFLGVARSMTSAGPQQDSEVMRWNGLTFVSDHTLQIGWCTSIKYFESDASHYLVVSDHGRGLPFESVGVVVFRYEGAMTGWKEMQRIGLPSEMSIHDLILISAWETVHLIVSLSHFNHLCQGAFSCMQSAVFECDESNRTQDIRFHSAGNVIVPGGVLERTTRCRWVIAPPRAAEVAVNFDYVHSESCCFRITIFSCVDATCTNMSILSQYSPTADHAENLDAIGKMNASSPTGVVAMELETFTQAEPAVTCSGICECEPSTGKTAGTLSDGPGNTPDNALSGDTCQWLIVSHATISLTFASFATEENYDYVRIKRCQDASCSLSEPLGELHGSHDPAMLQSYVSSPTTGYRYLQVQFTSDSTTNYAGFVANWNLQSPAGWSSRPLSTEKYLSMHFSTVAKPAQGSLEVFRWHDADSDSPNRFKSKSSLPVASKGGNAQVALDLEHFERDGGNYLVVSSALTAEPSSPSADSLIYQLQSGSSLTISERLENQTAVRCRHIKKDGIDYLLLASYTGNFRVYRWAGSAFEASANYDRALANLETIDLGDSILIGAVDSPGENLHTYWRSSSPKPTWIRIMRWNDAMEWQGTIRFSDAFTPSASFVVRQLKETTHLPSHNRTFVATLRPDRTLPPGVTIRISGISGVHRSAARVQITGQDAATFSGAGTWIQATKQLELETSKWIDSDKNTSFIFSLDKDLEPRTALNAHVTCDGPITILPQSMENMGKYWPAQTGRLRQDCNVGYSAVDGFPCRACAPGFYKVTFSLVVLLT